MQIFNKYSTHAYLIIIMNTFLASELISLLYSFILFVICAVNLFSVVARKIIFSVIRLSGEKNYLDDILILAFFHVFYRLIYEVMLG